MTRSALPVSCFAQKVHELSGASWEVRRRKADEKRSRVIATGSTLKEARHNAREFLAAEKMRMG